MFLQWLEYTVLQELVHVRQIKRKRKFCYTNELTVATRGDWSLSDGWWHEQPREGKIQRQEEGRRM